MHATIFNQFTLTRRFGFAYTLRSLNSAIPTCTHRRYVANMSARRMKNPVLFICDLQEKFRPAIHEFPAVVATTTKLLRAASILKIPVLATTQLRAKLGETCPELELDKTYPTAAHVDKSAFSMYVPEIVKALDGLPQQPVDVNKDTTSKRQPFDCLIVGIETHICVLQTTIDLLAKGHRVWVIQDGVSSCNKEERLVALERARQEGAKVTTSESVLYECIGDAADDAFREISKLVKETKDSTQNSVQALCHL